MLLLLFVTVCGSSIGVESLPLPDSGPHLANDWGEAVRLRHLYASRRGLHLQINTDGEIRGSHMQSSDSLVEIWPVGTGRVAIKGVASSRFLCMERSGKLYGSHTYSKEDCSFMERILPDGYNIYVSSKHGVLVNLAKDGTSASQFLPMVNTLSQEPTDRHSGEQRSLVDPEQDHQLGLQIDSMDPFWKELSNCDPESQFQQKMRSERSLVDVLRKRLLRSRNRRLRRISPEPEHRTRLSESQTAHWTL